MIYGKNDTPLIFKHKPTGDLKVSPHVKKASYSSIEYGREGLTIFLHFTGRCQSDIRTHGEWRINYFVPQKKTHRNEFHFLCTPIKGKVKLDLDVVNEISFSENGEPQFRKVSPERTITIDKAYRPNQATMAC